MSKLYPYIPSRVVVIVLPLLVLALLECILRSIRDVCEVSIAGINRFSFLERWAHKKGDAK